MTAGSLAVIFSDIIAVAAYAIGLRAVVDLTRPQQATLALWIAAGTAVAFALTMVLQDMQYNLIGTVTDRVGRLELNPRIHADIAGIDTLDHLERPEYLDRVTVVRGSSVTLMRGAWNAISIMAGAIKLLVTILLLGSVSPWLLVLIALSFVPIWTNQRGQRLVAEAEVATAEDYRLQQQLFDLLVQADSGKEIRVSGNGEPVGQLQTDAWNSVTNRRFLARLSAAVWKLAGWLVFTIGFTSGLTVVAYQVTQGRGTVGDLVLIVTIASSLQQSMQAIVKSVTDAAGSTRVTEPYLWLQDYAAHNRTSSTCEAMTPGKLVSGIVVENLSFIYPGSETAALDHVCMSLPASSVTAIVGEYGSGKTTLVKMLFKLHTPDEGRILVDGTDIASLAPSAWRVRTTAAFQDFGRYHIAFGDTIGLGDLPRREEPEAIREAVLAANATELVSRLPDGLNTPLGRELGGIDLSEGQWQLTALGRASMRNDPLLLVLDEPTASLDAPSEHNVFLHYMKRARVLARTTGAATIVVSHRFSSVAEADQIIVLDRGQVVETGTHQELLPRGGRYAELYGIQARAYSERMNT
ncbi:ABC transporter permease [Ktedonobacter sp. SOSP1-52]|nr:ABC transporter permease [Ktedonobacter sp. SOSP1-52]